MPFFSSGRPPQEGRGSCEGDRERPLPHRHLHPGGARPGGALPLRPGARGHGHRRVGRGGGERE